MSKILSYDEWQALSDEEKLRVHLSWNTYERENIGIPFMAGAKLVSHSKREIYNISVGIYHGGEYLIHATVSDEEFLKCPPSRAEEFEGIKIVWLPEDPSMIKPEEYPPPVSSEKMHPTDIPTSFDSWSDIVEFAKTFSIQEEFEKVPMDRRKLVLYELSEQSCIPEIRLTLFSAYRSQNRLGYGVSGEMFESALNAIELLRKKLGG